MRPSDDKLHGRALPAIRLNHIFLMLLSGVFLMNSRDAKPAFSIRRKPTRGNALSFEALEDRRLLAGLPELLAVTDLSGPYEPFLEIPASPVGAPSYLAPSSAVAFSVETADLRAMLADAPMEFTTAGFERPLEFSIPKPDGSMGRFSVVEAPVMHPDLAAKFPEIKTYRGQGIDNPTETIRFDVTPQGLHAQVLSPDGVYYIDPFYHLDTSVYVSYAGENAGYSEQAEQLGADFYELGVVEDGVLVTSNGSFELGEDGSLTEIEGGDRFTIYTPGNYDIQDDGTLSVTPDTDVRLTYAADEFHVHNDGTVHVRVSAEGEKSGGGCPGCGGAGCENCAPGGDAAVADSQTDLTVSAISAEVGGQVEGQVEGRGEGGEAGIARRTGETLRTYRLANATTVEYSNFNGGTQASSQAAVVTSINRVTGITELELTIRLELVANNDQLIFTSATGDSYSNGNLGAMLGQNQSVVDSVIGNANYDIGHVFGTGGGGVAAGLGIVGISGIKAQGVSTSGVPLGASYDGLVAHEMGHQFGAAHTWNGAAGNCSAGQHSSSSSYEPGSGSTIQAYAGICGSDNIQNSRDLYWHSRSLDQILSHVDGSIPGVGTRTVTGNSEPVADAGPNFEIPAGTPFILSGSGSDPDGDTLTYAWEQRDLGPRVNVNAADNGSSPLVRSRLDSDPTRVFPSEENLVAGNYQFRGDRLPTVARRMDFRLTVRDNASGGGGLDTDDMWVDINDTGSPFEVTSQGNGVAWLAGQTQTITWNVAGTDSGQINTPNVDIIISDDGGFTYTIPLATGIPNNGSHTFTVPTLPEISQARLMVKGSGNIFFDINDENFAIIDEDTSPPTASANVGNITSAGSLSTFIAVTYTDNQAVDASDLDSNDIVVEAPDGTMLPVVYVSQSSNSDAPSIVGNYRLSAPGGDWSFDDNGVYIIRLVAGEVTDVDENTNITDVVIDTFEVNIAAAVGDFNEDGNLDCHDIDALTTAVSSGNNDPVFDVTGEGVLNFNDVNFWVEDLKGTLRGDANLDFTVDGQDFLIWNSNKFSSGTAWCSGDFNADGTTDGSDFLVWNDFKFQATDVVLPSVKKVAQSTDRTDAAIGLINSESETDRIEVFPAPTRVALSQAVRNNVIVERAGEEEEAESVWADLADEIFATK